MLKNIFVKSVFYSQNVDFSFLSKKIYATSEAILSNALLMLNNSEMPMGVGVKTPVIYNINAMPQ